MKIQGNLIEFQNDLQDVLNLFFDKNDLTGFEINYIEGDTFLINKQLCEVPSYSTSNKKQQKRMLKNAIYKVLSAQTKINLPWGSMTGIRPTMLAYEFLSNGGEISELLEYLRENFFVEKQKAIFCQKIIENQNQVIKNKVNEVDFYVHIPICPSKCYYCSFPSSELKYVVKQLDNYVDTLCYEIKQVLSFLKQNNLRINSLYFGGGTPTVLSAQQLNKLLGPFKDLDIMEKVVECGRPDTITADKLKCLKANNVSRICVNPQTFCDKTLKRIGRNHTSSETIKVYKMAKQMGFVVNMDLIAGLDGEKTSTFCRSLRKAIRLKPDNITVHTLCVKNGSTLKAENNNRLFDDKVVKMVNYSMKKLTAKGYAPYYLYRQKSMISNLENIGYAKQQRFCKFNIDSMEEISTIVACGAGAITKVIGEGRLITRQANVKGIKEYLERVDEMILKKEELIKLNLKNANNLK